MGSAAELLLDESADGLADRRRDLPEILRQVTRARARVTFPVLPEDLD
jgi:hypothetical protein